jgi:tRNA (uracil-5-)-methyltransferase TRM9
MGHKARGTDEAEAAYDAIAEAWARTRSGPWPEVTSFLGTLPRGARVADVGGGSGRYLKVREAEGLRMVAFDVSRGQLAVARRDIPGARLVRADARWLPARSGSADAGLLVAVLHHFERPEDRRAALEELRRVLAPGARAVITVWGTHDEDFSTALKAPGGGANDYLVPFKEGQQEPVMRFFHAYVEAELSREAKAAGFADVRAWEERGNWVAEVAR